MAPGAAAPHLSRQARRLYTEELVKGLASAVQASIDGARALLDKPAEHATMWRRRDLVQALNASAKDWYKFIVRAMRAAEAEGVAPAGAPPAARADSGGPLTLVDDDTIELEIVTSRLALAIMDRASWEFSDLRSRIAHLEGRGELEPQDPLRAHVLARVVFEGWRASGQTLEAWRELQPVLHDEFAHLVEGAYHEVNRWLAEQRVLPEVDLRPFIRRSREHPNAPLGSIWQHSVTPADDFARGRGGPASGFGGGGSTGGSGGGGPSGGFGGAGRGGVGEETRMMTRAAPLARNREHAEALLGRLNRLVGRHLPGFASAASGATQAAPLSPGLARAIDAAQTGIRQRFAPSAPAGHDASAPGDGSAAGAPGAADTAVVPPATTPALLEELHQRKQVLKKAAGSAEERATIEIVALLFQSILTEERIPAAVRVWFARLQMPVLRVAVGEPDFFATVDHPARRLIDRMGACVMGFDSAGSSVGDALEREVKRVVQVVEAYPDTGRRVFQTVLAEFEKFLEHYFSHENELTKKGVSLAQQVEQRETLAIQYTIELRRMLNEVPVQEGVRQFLFHVWADVLATTAVRYGAQGDQTRAMKRAAADLIWSASAKVTREERAEVIRRLPPLLKHLREGMGAAGIDAARQDEQIQQLNNSLAAAFTAKAAVIPDDRLRELMDQLETLEELLPDAADVQIDEAMVLDLSGHQGSELEVVLEGGSMPTPAMIAWARELQVGSWYMLELRGSIEPVQLAWQGLRRHLSLFVTTQGRCVLFQQHRLASFLQAGLIVPAQDESLTVRATRNALAKLDVDASALE